MNIRIHSIDFKGSIVDGPGIRVVLFLQGCLACCPGCHNPDTLPLDGGYDIPVRELANQIKKNSPNRKITISGGEPLLQKEAVLELLPMLDGYSIALYTGMDLEDVPEEIRSKLDYLKVGRYDINLRSTVLDYCGSTNQSFIDMKGNKS